MQDGLLKSRLERNNGTIRWFLGLKVSMAWASPSRERAAVAAQPAGACLLACSALPGVVVFPSVDWVSKGSKLTTHRAHLLVSHLSFRFGHQDGFAHPPWKAGTKVRHSGVPPSRPFRQDALCRMAPPAPAASSSQSNDAALQNNITVQV